MNKWIYTFCFIFICIFALVGAFFLSIVFHELSHRQDLNQYVNNNSELCFFSYPGNASLKELVFGDYALGWFEYDYRNDTPQTIKDKIQSTTETKSYSITIIVLLIFFVCMCIEIFRRFENKDAEDFYLFFKKWKRDTEREQSKHLNSLSNSNNNNL